MRRMRLTWPLGVGCGGPSVAELAVVLAQEVPVLAAGVLVERRGALDLVFAAADVDLPGIAVNTADDSRRKHHFAAEDPRSRVDDDAARAHVVRRRFDRTDAPVARLHVESHDVSPTRHPRVPAVGPRIPRGLRARSGHPASISTRD